VYGHRGTTDTRLAQTRRALNERAAAAANLSFFLKQSFQGCTSSTPKSPKPSSTLSG
jgi:hypothetical protein